jgi:hypothetical protein
MLETWGIVYQPDILTIIGLIVNVITATTFVVQIIGPLMCQAGPHSRQRGRPGRSGQRGLGIGRRHRTVSVKLSR